MYENRIDGVILATLVADTYSLSSHWVYDKEELKNLPIDWNELGGPNVSWHEGKKLGDFTHYGDQINILLSYIQRNPGTFDINKYMPYWRDEIAKINTYIDGATKETIENLENGKKFPCGSSSHDMAAIGRSFPLLKVSKTKKEFLENALVFVKATHDNSEVLQATEFFASLLLAVLDGKDVLESIELLKKNCSTNIEQYIDTGLNSQNTNTTDTLLSFGTHCGVEVGMSGVIHILSKYTNFEEALIANAQCGGDTSSRAMIIGAIFTAKNGESDIPTRWQKYIKE